MRPPPPYYRYFQAIATLMLQKDPVYKAGPLLNALRSAAVVALPPKASPGEGEGEVQEEFETDEAVRNTGGDRGRGARAGREYSTTEAGLYFFGYRQKKIGTLCRRSPPKFPRPCVPFRTTTRISRKNNNINGIVVRGCCLHRVRIFCLPLTHTVDDSSYQISTSESA